MTDAPEAFARDVAHITTLFWHATRHAYLPWTMDEIQRRSSLPESATTDALNWMIERRMCERRRNNKKGVGYLELTTAGVIVAEKQRLGLQREAAE